MKILLADTIHPLFEKLLAKEGHYCEDASALSKQQVIERLHDHSGIVIRSRFVIDKAFLDAAPR